MKNCELEKMRNKLPKSPGILCKTEFTNSVVLIPLIMLDGEYHFLFQKRSPHIRQGGEVCFPGGMYDPMEDTSIKKTAIREMQEEMGISQDKINIIGSLDTHITPMGVTIDSFIGVVKINSMDELVINKDEVDYAFTVPVSYFESHKPEKYKARVMIEPTQIERDGSETVLFPAKELGLPEIYTKPWGGRYYSILIYRYKEEIIWGITARLVQGVVNLLR